MSETPEVRITTAWLQSIENKLDSIHQDVKTKCDSEDCDKNEERIHNLEKKVNRALGGATALWAGVAAWFSAK